MTATFEEQSGKTKLTMHMLFDTAIGREVTAEKSGAVEGARQPLERLAEFLARV